MPDDVTPLASTQSVLRVKGLEGLRTALKDAKTYGATTVLLVPGKVADPKKAEKVLKSAGGKQNHGDSPAVRRPLNRR